MSPHFSIAHYRITAKLGEGGMGEVYRATDTKLGREVAIKVLPEAFASNADRMARFQREAQVLASLNHPNIAAIYGVEQGALVMELVEGEDLKGPLPVETVVNYARQIAAGLEAAHEKGIVHRDLKPANIKVTRDGVVKLLDFGLAATTVRQDAAGATVTMSLTQAGMILGTAAYMAPEQAAGNAVDKRADIWAFGVVLYEMLSGKRLFEGETSAHTLVNVMAKEFDLSAIAPPMRPLLRHCLQRDPRSRLRDIGDARLMLEGRSDAPIEERRSTRLPWAVAGAAVVLAALVVGGDWNWTKPVETGMARFPLAVPEGSVIDAGSLAVPQAVPSPDGKFIAYVVQDIKTQETNLWVHSLGSAAAYRIEKSEGARAPFWSPDSRFIGFFAERILKRVPVSGGVPIAISEVEGQGFGATWNAQGTIVFASNRGPLRRVSAGGGPAAPVTELDAALEETRHLWPQFTADSRHLIYFAGSRDPAKTGVYLTELGSSTRTLLLMNASRAIVASPGHLLFVRDGALLAQRIHPKTAQLQGDPVSLAPAVIHNGPNASFAASGTVLVFRSGALANARQLAWYSRDGKRLNSIGSSGEYASVSLSPDGQRATLLSSSSTGRHTSVMELSSGSLTQLTQATGNFYPAVWSPDSQQIAVTASTEIRIIDIATRAATVLSSFEAAGAASDWLSNSRVLLYADRTRIGLLPIEPPPAGAKRELKVLLVASVPATQLDVSPDERWVAYASDETGERQVYVASFPAFADRHQISTSGGSFPVWRSDGKELFFLAPGAVLMSARIQSGSPLEFETPKLLFKANLTYPSLSRQFGVSPDGQRFLIAELGPNSQKIEDTVVLNWSAGLNP
jgi:Tol biopolymer transport system component/predicted Ser/Thr protein kinase